MPLSILSTINRSAVARQFYKKAPSGGGGGSSFTTTNGTATTNSGYNVIYFTTSASSITTNGAILNGSISISSLGSTPLTIYYLAVGSGGLGSPDVGGGGGGGAVVASSFTINSPTTINVSVNGKVGGINSSRNGGNAWINGIGFPSIVAGGGYGGLGNVQNATPVTTAYGGSGAGAAYNTTTPTIVTLNPNTYANLGGIGNGSSFTGGGGGGAGSAGQQATPSSNRGGSGGNGKLYTSIPGYSPAINNILTTLSGYGTSLAAGYLGAGGGGGTNTSNPSDIGPGGSNGAGGPGSLISIVGGSATVFGGGGGGSGGSSVNGGASFQGIVMIAFK